MQKHAAGPAEPMTADRESDASGSAPDYETLVRQAQTATDPAREQAFERLIEQFRAAAEAWAYGSLGDLHAAQDAAQEAFITAYERLDDLREPAAFPAWLRRIVWTQSHRARRQQRDVMPLDDTAPDADDPAQTVEQHILYDRVHRAVRELPDHERVVVELFYLNGYSQQEIAERLNLPLTTVKKRLQYARERLRETMPPITMRHRPAMQMRRAA